MKGYEDYVIPEMTYNVRLSSPKKSHC